MHSFWELCSFVADGMLIAFTENLKEEPQCRTLHLAQGMCMNHFPSGEDKAGKYPWPPI